MLVLIYKIRHRWGQWLSKFVAFAPKTTRILRMCKIPINGYMPVLPRGIVLASMENGGVTYASPIRTSRLGLRSLIESQEAPHNKFEGNLRPIRISKLRHSPDFAEHRSRLISKIWPGDPYGFEDEQEFLDQYRASHYAFSPKKGGWDTMRHLEIMGSGCIPIIPKVNSISEMALFGYPKRFLEGIWDFVQADSLPTPTYDDHKWVQQWSTQYLSSEAQARFILTESGFDQNGFESVFYLDFSLMDSPDYVSMGNLVGLYRVLRQNQLRTLQLPRHLIESNKEYYKSLYGKGFGYSSELSGRGLQEADVTSLQILVEKAIKIISTETFGLLVVGGIEYMDSNPELRFEFLSLLTSLSPRSAVVYGGDFKLSAHEQERLSKISLLFIREF